ncbi:MULTISPECIES: ABC transporter ATP-binding protein [Empedobacter]|uniref:ATP-binding cassette domain-containing protein n=1 Tax=Empedobacter falsenii TaxID=343874 RepID=A0A427BKE2_9FLAO|nr:MULTISPECIES: ATP-binding cassette domain-containing protein [Empedobacter]MBW1618122.1 ATP-binding cassette domain-containing protein [Empedobacter falsenii]RRT89719.1 ATP-binding cassette domain-containing protein [Empedobacter falsenii]RRT89788.1 ATP-binding cassette domain-containing protein [Empedobacter falsenii]
MKSIEIKDLNFSFGSKQILNQVNLNVPKGSIYGYLGRNGAGKSTTIKLLLGLLNSNEDTIFLNELSIKKHPIKIHALTGNLIEAPCFYTKLTVYENLKYLDVIYQKGEERISEVLDLVDLLYAEHYKTSDLSMGMKQRLGIAIAIFHDPEILILDEPLNGLDAQGIYEMRELFLRLNASGKTIFLSSHILSELERVATHIGIIEGGKMIFEGKKEELLGNVVRKVAIKINDAEKAKQLFENVIIEDNVMHFEIENDDDFHQKIQQLIQHNIKIYDVQSETANLEQIFINLIQH